MSRPPVYFERIRQGAARRWEQLESDPELAGPWHQLFKQVQSPRHILSELLQNADDARATEASVRIESGMFIFEHNGEDFSEEHFASICRFGYSNKRALHTIGFRGVGFKSTFSLGDEVQLITPSLWVSFNRRRFTEPRWVDHELLRTDRTLVCVEIADDLRQKEVERNLEEWLRSPVSLLFFNSIRKVVIAGRQVHWASLGPGPIPNSEWMALDGNADDAHLLVRSVPQVFPPDALEEIRQERMLGADEQGDFPPCKIEIVLGTKGRLFVVLPTGVETELPFACNAPFVQDPARLKIKDPETSPTNRWLLERAGALAASAMVQWLGTDDGSEEGRARAYSLLPDVDRNDSSLEGVCGTTVELAFGRDIAGKPIVLTQAGGLVEAEQCVALPPEILEIWDSEQVTDLLDEKARPPLSRHVSVPDRLKLIHWGMVEEIDKPDLLELLRAKGLPKPRTWGRLLNLWIYLAPDLTSYLPTVPATEVRIVPVHGRDVLCAASEVVRLGEKKLLQSNDDWEFLAGHLIVLNQNWTRYLADRRREVAEDGNDTERAKVESALSVLGRLALAETSDVGKVVDKVASSFFGQGKAPLADCVRLAQIAAKLNAPIGDAFLFATRDLKLRGRSDAILWDSDGSIEDLVPRALRDALLLHPSYFTEFKSCSPDEWQRWVASGAAGLMTCPSIGQARSHLYNRSKVEKEAQRRGRSRELSYRYVTSHFIVEDWDFPESYWTHWETQAAEDSKVWVRVTRLLLNQRESFWAKAKSARILQVATTGNTSQITWDPLLPEWVLKLRDKPCLLDVKGFCRKPDELLRRTPETEALLDVEPFVHGQLDREAARSLLDLLGVRSTPTGPDGLLQRLRALAKSDNPPVHEVEKWYVRLDRMLDSCSTADLQQIRDAFQTDRLILAHDGAWVSSGAAFISPDDDVPEAAIVRTSVADLALWRKIGMAERPSADLAIGWLTSLPSANALSTDELRRVRSLLVRYPTRVWQNCGHWLNLAGEWVPVDRLRYALTMQSLVPWTHLHPWVKQATADLQKLSGEVTGAPPFSSVPTLSTRLEERFVHGGSPRGRGVRPDWMVALGTELAKAEFEPKDETARVRQIAKVLCATEWIEVPSLALVPYIDGKPAGTPRQADVVWIDTHLYVRSVSRGRLARRVPEELGRIFGRSDIKAAMDYGFERAPESIRAYLMDNFTIRQDHEIEESAPPAGTGGATSESPPQTELIAGTDQTTAEPDASATATDASPQDDEIDSKVGQGEGKEESSGTQNDASGSRHRPEPRPARPSLIERFARSHGFKPTSDERFSGKDGSWIGRSRGSPFEWELYSDRGDLIRSYFVKDHCLEAKPLQIEAEVWGLLEQAPDAFSLILTGPDGEPTEISGRRLTAMRDQGTITLHPATYRVVYDEARS